MNLVDIINKDLILPDLSAKHKKEVLEELCRAVAEDRKVSPVPLLQVLMDRERLGSTGIGDGVAIPHGKTEQIDKMVIACGRSREGVDFESMDGRPTHLFFLLLAPENTTGEHLKALAKLSRLLKDPSFRQEFLAAEDQSDLFELITSRGDL
jgi:PTS system nitrogen regulatory IIA component